MLSDLTKTELASLLIGFHHCGVLASMWRFLIHSDVHEESILLGTDDVADPVQALLTSPYFLSRTQFQRESV